jgi:very-short-patch-repair endonuclease
VPLQLHSHEKKSITFRKYVERCFTIFSNAKRLRENPTPAEELMWLSLRNNQLMDINLEDPSIIKVCSRFYCHQLKLVIEIDGEYHQTEQQKLDNERTKY